MNEFHKRVLANNVTVLFEKRQSPVVSISINVNAGGGFETEKEKGMHHVIEHMLFKGTKTRTKKEIANTIERKGGILNGFTSEETTSFWLKMPARHFDTGFGVLADTFLNPKFEKSEFDREKSVIAEEINLYNDNPTFYVSHKIKEMLYKKPFGLSLAGTVEGVRGLGRQHIMQKFRNDFKNKVIVSAVGRANFENICNFVQRFPKCSPNSINKKFGIINRELSEKRKNMDQAHFIFGYRCPEQGNEKRYLYDLILIYLAGGMSSVLHNEIREKRGLAYAIRPDIDRERNFGFSTIYVGTEKTKAEKIREIILKSFNGLKKIRQKDFNETKEQLIGLRKLAEEDSGSVMHTLMFEEFGKNAEEYYKFDERIGAIRLKDVQNFKLKNFSTFSLLPE